MHYYLHVCGENKKKLNYTSGTPMYFMFSRV